MRRHGLEASLISYSAAIRGCEKAARTILFIIVYYCYLIN